MLINLVMFKTPTIIKKIVRKLNREQQSRAVRSLALCCRIVQICASTSGEAPNTRRIDESHAQSNNDNNTKNRPIAELANSILMTWQNYRKL